MCICVLPMIQSCMRDDLSMNVCHYKLRSSLGQASKLTIGSIVSTEVFRFIALATFCLLAIERNYVGQYMHGRFNGVTPNDVPIRVDNVFD